MKFRPWQLIHRRELAESGQHSSPQDIQSSINPTPLVYLRLSEGAEPEENRRSRMVRVGAIFASLMVALPAVFALAPDEALAADPSWAAGAAGVVRLLSAGDVTLERK